MRERDENAYIRFFALWFAAGMTLGVLLLLAASRTGMKEGNTVRLFQAEAFLGKKDLRKGLLFLPSEGAAGAGICRTSLWTDGDRRVFCRRCRAGIRLPVRRLSRSRLSAERYRRASALFPCPLSTDFSLSCGIVSDGSRMQSDGGDESSGRGHAEKRVFPLWRPLLFRTDSASLGHSARKLRQPVVPLRKSCKNGRKRELHF